MSSFHSIPFRLDPAESSELWGGIQSLRVFFNELLPACFERVLDFDQLEIKGGGFDWIFTGPRAGLTIRVRAEGVQLIRRYYDSVSLVEENTNLLKHPEKTVEQETIHLKGPLRQLALSLDSRLELRLKINGDEVCRETWMFDCHRHQLTGRDLTGLVTGRLLQPDAVPVPVRVNPEQRHQAILGFGGCILPTAYRQLSDEGKRRWWQLLAEFNFLVHREYPMGAHLNPEMDNWDSLEDAVPHYYGDNFPNSEVSDFTYLKEVRSIGGSVLFEFWALPVWARKEGENNPGGDVDYEKYAAAIVRYCQISRERTGAPPDIVGIQNEQAQTAETYHGMTHALRRALDEAGFQDVKLNMADSGAISWKEDGRETGGLDVLKKFHADSTAWDAIDYAAVHMYDYQNHFTNPDGYDAVMREFRSGAGKKPLLSTELCINYGRFQSDSYRLAFQMGQLYHKNLVIMDAVAIAYCWLLLNVEQPSYGATRSLFVPDLANGGLPVASSAQLRVMGAYSRCVPGGMVRLAAEAEDSDLLVTAFAGAEGHQTLVAINRSTRPLRLEIDWPGAAFTRVELCDPYSPNLEVSAAERRIPPGSILTLSNVKRR